MPHLHIMETYDHGNRMILHVLLSKLRSVLTIEKNFSEWEIRDLTHEDEIEAVVPDRFEELNGGWTLKPATKAQLDALANQINVPVFRIPVLSAFNAQLLIQTTLVKRHLPRVNEIIEEVLRNKGLNPGLQHVHSIMLESV